MLHEERNSLVLYTIARADQHGCLVSWPHRPSRRLDLPAARRRRGHRGGGVPAHQVPGVLREVAVGGEAGERETAAGQLGLTALADLALTLAGERGELEVR